MSGNLPAAAAREIVEELPVPVEVPPAEIETVGPALPAENPPQAPLAVVEEKEGQASVVALRYACRFLKKAICRRNTLPALSHVVFEDGWIYASDLDTTVRVWTSATPLPGCVPFELLERVAKATGSEGSLRIGYRRWSNDNEEVFLGDLRTNALPRGEYPSVMEVFYRKDRLATVQVGPLDAVLPAVSLDETRLNLSGLFFELCVDRVVATDGHRLHLIPSGISNAKGDYILAAAACSLAEMARKAGKLEKVRVDFYGPQARKATHAIFRAGDVEIATRLVEGEFPDYRQVIPKDQKHRVIVSKDRLLDAIERVKVVHGARGKGIELRRVSEGLRLRAQDPDRGEIAVVIPASGWEEDQSIGVNAQYLIDAVVPVQNEEVIISVTDEVSPISIVDGEYLAVVMPFRL